MSEDDLTEEPAWITLTWMLIHGVGVAWLIYTWIEVLFFRGE
jgi:hypothetical protein